MLESYYSVAETVMDLHQAEFLEFISQLGYYGQGELAVLLTEDYQHIQQENPHMSPTDIIMSAGERIMKRYSGVIGSKQTNRQQRKSKAAPVVDGVNVRTPAPKEAKPKTRSDVINDLRRQRGQAI